MLSGGRAAPILDCPLCQQNHDFATDPSPFNEAPTASSSRHFVFKFGLSGMSSPSLHETPHGRSCACETKPFRIFLERGQQLVRTREF